MNEYIGEGEYLTGRGLDARAGCGGLGLIGGIAAVVLACLIGLMLWYGVEDSRATRAQARASAENARAAAVAAGARAEADKEAIRAESALALQVERHEYELAASRLSESQFQRRLLLLAAIVDGMSEEELARLEAQAGAGQDRVKEPPAWSVYLMGAAILAVLVAFVGWEILMGLGRRSNTVTRPAAEWCGKPISATPEGEGSVYHER